MGGWIIGICCIFDMGCSGSIHRGIFVPGQKEFFIRVGHFDKIVEDEQDVWIDFS